MLSCIYFPVDLYEVCVSLISVCLRTIAKCTVFKSSVKGLRKKMLLCTQYCTGVCISPANVSVKYFFKKNEMVVFLVVHWKPSKLYVPTER